VTGPSRGGSVASGKLRVALNSIADPGMLSVRLPNGSQVVVIRRGEVVTVLEDECTHQAMPLSAGELLPDGSIECPWHGARFDCASGTCLQGPATDDVATYDARVEGNEVVIGDRRS
jgi:nitrite reductase/ring-hydroxylating ferredoxin subunit